MSAYICVRMVDMLFLSSRRRHTRFALVTGVQTVLFRSGDASAAYREVDPGAVRGDGDRECATGGAVGLRSECDGVVAVGEDQQLIAAAVVGDRLPELRTISEEQHQLPRSEARPGGTEWVSTCSTRWSLLHYT